MDDVLWMTLIYKRYMLKAFEELMLVKISTIIIIILCKEHQEDSGQKSLFDFSFPPGFYAT